MLSASQEGAAVLNFDAGEFTPAVLCVTYGLEQDIKDTVECDYMINRPPVSFGDELKGIPLCFQRISQDAISNLD